MAQRNRPYPSPLSGCQYPRFSGQIPPDCGPIPSLSAFPYSPVSLIGYWLSNIPAFSVQQLSGSCNQSLSFFRFPVVPSGKSCSESDGRHLSGLSCQNIHGILDIVPINKYHQSLCNKLQKFESK